MTALEQEICFTLDSNHINEVNEMIMVMIFWMFITAIIFIFYLMVIGENSRNKEVIKMAEKDVKQRRLFKLAICLYNSIAKKDYKEAKGINETINEVLK